MPENEDKALLTEGERLHFLNKLKTRLKDEQKLEKLQTNDPCLEKFLYGTDFDVDAAFNKITNYYELVLQYPDWFPILGPLDKKSIIDKDVRMMLPQYDKEGRVIFIAKLGNTDMSTMKLFDMIGIDDILLESVLASKPRIAQKGLCVIMDVADYPWKMLKWLTPENIKLCIRKIMALPFKDYRIHIVNTSVVIHVAIKITWPLLPAYIKEMIKFHFNDWDSLYKYIDKEVLPLEYGGTYNINYSELHEKLYEKNEEILAITKFRREVAFG
ncbi:alpha-tocopherol transfer protein-like [Anoplophora glabripennis]|uniref:alpha-tocopherol transfer protein-like n=1 Tax=Anoplophora glabripennis TaxID=217634 RepID=UPI0008741E2F|nr:alpha-tocopherol transfer protein-like [Anoplophora glabripennis]